VKGLRSVDGIGRVEVAGGGYVNAFFDRAKFWSGSQVGAKATDKLAAGRRGAADQKTDSQEWLSHKIIVEHTSINPNKAAHIGHARNAVLGDTMVRILRHTGNRVQIQNYIDNTGVQVADVVIGLLQMERVTPLWVKNRTAEPKFDYYCWELYAKATSFFGADKARAAKLRGETLKSI